MDTKNRIIVIIFALSLIAIISAQVTFELGKELNIQREYQQGESFKGSINISFENASSDSKFTTSEGDSISLEELLKKKSNLDYSKSCSPEICESLFNTTTKSPSNFEMSSNAEKTLGIKLQGNIDTSKEIKLLLNISTNASDSCQNQLELDIFSDGIIDYKNMNASGTTCTQENLNRGCYEDSKATNSNIDTEPYCQRILIPEAPSLNIGGIITGNGSLDFRIFNKTFGEKLECTYATQNPVTNRKVSCEIKKNIPSPKEYYVCLQKNEGEFQIKSYDDSLTGCGFYRIPSNGNVVETGAYNIFVEPSMFGSVMIEIDDSNLNKKIMEYLKGRYGNEVDCSNSPTGSCTLPLTLKSNVNQNITIENVELSYKTASRSTTEKEIYLTKKIPAKITSNYQDLNLDEANFNLPGIIGKERAFSIYFNGEELFNEDIIVLESGVVNGILPEETAALIPTTFVAFLEEGFVKKIKEYNWNFGEGKNLTTTSPNITYTYSNVGSYNLTLKLKDSLNRIYSSTFTINVSAPKELIESTIEKKIDSLAEFKSKFNLLSPFEKELILKKINISSLEEELTKIKSTYDNSTNSTNDTVYIDLAKKLTSLKIPESIKTNSKLDATIFVEKNNINPSLIDSITGESTDILDEEAYRNTILDWSNKNINAKLKTKELTLTHKTFSEKVGNIYDILVPSKSSRVDSYLIIKDLEGMKFKSNYSEKKINGYFAIPLTSSQKTITFSSTEEIKIADLPIVFSPALSELSVITLEKDAPDESNMKLWIIFGIVLLGLIILAFIGYVFLAKWYKDKYEDYLFKNKNDLINIFSFIQDGKKKGLDDSEIKSNLKKAGWNGEQVNYSLKKYNGRKTGLFQISFFKQKLKEAETRIPPVKTPPQFNNFNPNQRRGFIPR